MSLDIVLTLRVSLDYRQGTTSTQQSCPLCTISTTDLNHVPRPSQIFLLLTLFDSSFKRRPLNKKR